MIEYEDTLLPVHLEPLNDKMIEIAEMIPKVIEECRHKFEDRDVAVPDFEEMLLSPDVPDPSDASSTFKAHIHALEAFEVIHRHLAEAADDLKGELLSLEYDYHMLSEEIQDNIDRRSRRFGRFGR